MMETQTIESMPIGAENISPKEKTLSDFQLAALEKAEKDLEDLKKEIEKKKYLVDLKKEDISKLRSFIMKDAKWKFTEALGIIEVNKALDEASKAGKLFTSSLAIEAIYYYMSKVEGKGMTTDSNSKDALQNLEDYIRVLKAITGCIEKIKLDTEKVRNAEFIVAARREGIDPDSSINNN